VSGLLVTEVQVRTQEHSIPQRLRINVVVAPGQPSTQIPFDDRLFRALRSDAFIHLECFFEMPKFGAQSANPLEGLYH
jgi:hypothetical protein